MVGVRFGDANEVSGFVTKLFHIHRLFSKEVAVTDCTLQEVCQHRQFLVAFGIALKGEDVVLKILAAFRLGTLYTEDRLQSARHLGRFELFG